MSGFERSALGRISIELTSDEHRIVGSLAQQMIDLLTPEDEVEADPLAAIVGISPDAKPPEDPALARLLPAAYPDDEEASAEFRRFTDRALRDGKIASATAVIQDLQASNAKIKIRDPHAWLTFLTDARITIGVRIGVSADNYDELLDLTADDPRSAMFGIYDWLTYVQETLIRAILGSEYT